MKKSRLLGALCELIKPKIALVVTIALGASVAATNASAIVIADGTYTIEILFSPEFFTSGLADPGVAGGQVNTSLTFQDTPMAGLSQGILNDTDPTVVNQVGGVGSGVADGRAGFGTLTVSGGVISVSDWNIDNFINTGGGIFSQEEGNLGLWTGSTNASTTTINPVGRVAEIEIVAGSGAKPWNYAALTTGAVNVTTNLGNTLTWSGTPVAAANLDGVGGLDDYTLALAGAGIFGNEWVGHAGLAYIEVYSIELTRMVPVPAAVYLFGSGLLGLAGMARRKKTVKGVKGDRPRFTGFRHAPE